MPDSTQHLDDLYAALGHTKRRSILTTLSFRPATVSQLAQEHGVSLPAIHKHLRVMEHAALIQRRKAGRSNFVALNRASLKVAQLWLAQFQTSWGSDAETLENYISNLTNP